MGLHMSLGLSVVVDDGRDRGGGGLPHVNRSKRLLLHRDRLHRHCVVDHLHIGVGETIRGGSIDIGVGNIVHFQLFTHLTSLFFSLLGECLVVKEPLEMVLPQCLGSVEVGW